MAVPMRHNAREDELKQSRADTSVRSEGDASAGLALAYAVHDGCLCESVDGHRERNSNEFGPPSWDEWQYSMERDDHNRSQKQEPPRVARKDPEGLREHISDHQPSRDDGSGKERVST